MDISKLISRALDGARRDRLNSIGDGLDKRAKLSGEYHRTGGDCPLGSQCVQCASKLGDNWDAPKEYWRQICIHGFWQGLPCRKCGRTTKQAREFAAKAAAAASKP